MARFYTKKALRTVQEKWGKEETAQNPDFRRLEDNFARMMKKDDWILDDQTWNDLDMNRNFLKMNRTFTSSGQQCLYNMLRILCFDEEELKRREKMLSFFQINKEKREQLQCILQYVGKDEYDAAASLLYNKAPELPQARAWVLPCTLGMLASILSIPFLKIRALFLIVVFFVMNIFVHNSINRYTEQAMPGIRTIARMLKAAQEISSLNMPELKDRYGDFFARAVDRCGVIMKKSGALGSGTGWDDPLGLSAYLQIFFLSEARAYLRCASYITEYAPVLRTVYRRLGELDALQSMASVRRGLRHSCRPHFTEKPNCYSVTKLGHPALKGAVCNDLTLDGKNAVITGSNMSGKSTFLRTIGFNQILAQTFCFVMAKTYECSWFNVVTSISPEDDMEEGKSYYMAEAQALLRMLPVVETSPEEGRSAMLLIDEIFRGTNPAERVAGASALLEYLAEKKALVLVATHDEEITRRIREQYDSYHFEENVTKESLSFDYLLKEGPLTKPNGIRILEYIGYPEEIIQNALQHMEENKSEKADNETV